MSFVIEKNVPHVATPRGRKPTEFPFQSMEVSDSFLIPLAEDLTAEAFTKAVDSWRRKIRLSVKVLNKEYDCKFSTAVVPEGLRVYRTA